VSVGVNVGAFVDTDLTLLDKHAKPVVVKNS